MPTTGPQKGNSKSKSIGIAAHICAASVGGPRFDITMTEAQRRSFENGIWLCANCSIEIDKDQNFFTVELLRAWKAKAEEKANSEIGKKLPTENDASDLLVTALTGYPKKLLPKAISNIHRATTTSLQALDPRFKVNTSFIDGATHFEIHALEPTEIRMTVQGLNVQEYQDKYARLDLQGEDLEISTDGITFHGSKLFEDFLSECDEGILKISSPKKKAICKLTIKLPESSEIFVFDDVVGNISFGSIQGSFKGSACNGMLSIEISPLKPDIKSCEATFELNLDQWEGTDIRLLPYLDKLLTLFSKACIDKALLQVDLEADGNSLVKFTCSSFKNEFFQQSEFYLDYIKCTKTIANYISTPILFDSKAVITAPQYYKIKATSELIKSLSSDFSKDDSISYNFEMILDPAINSEFMRHYQDQDPMLFKVQQELLELNIFNTTIQIPASTYTLNNFLIRLESPGNSQKNVPVKFQLVSTKQSSISSFID